MILWPLLYLACHDNLQKDFDGQHGIHQYGERLFPFKILWQNDPNGVDYPREYTRAALERLVKCALLDQFPAQHPDRALFERICHVCSFMCAHDPKDRKMLQQSPLSATEQCFNYLVSGDPTAYAGAAAAPPALIPAADTTFDAVCQFIDNFCASGHIRASAQVVNATDGYRKIAFSSRPSLPVEYRVSPEKCWLFLNTNPDPTPHLPLLKFEDCQRPDYCVLPTRDHVPDPRAIFLPRNKFCMRVQDEEGGMLDVARLTLLVQSDWFTVFRYERPGGVPWIIK
jgi:hypothetical protein